jgi:acyl-CoA thioester hydrolase
MAAVRASYAAVVTTQTVRVRWDDVDANGHAGNTAYSAFATDARLAHFAAHGFTVARMQAMRIGPILFTETLTYRRELNLGDTVTVTTTLGSRSPTGHRWTMDHRLLRDDDLVATVSVSGAWIRMDERTLVEPTAELRAVLDALPRTEA